MKTVINITVVLMLILFAGCKVSDYHKANVAYKNMGYYKAVRYYEKYLQDHDKPKATFRLAESYRMMHDYERAEAWYTKAIGQYKLKSGDKYNFATILKTNGKYAEAKYWFKKYLDEVPGDKMAMDLMASCDVADDYYRLVYKYDVQPLGINIGDGNYAPAPYGKGYIFCSERTTSDETKISDWDGHPYLDLYYTAHLGNGELSEATLMPKSLNSPYHDGPAVVDPAGDHIYFTRSNYANDKLGVSTKNVNHLKIYTAKRNSPNWTGATELPFNSNEYSSGHPALSADGKQMYFISDRPGGIGKTDIYVSTYANGNWSKPVNLGGQINTAGYEMFPYYFEEDGKAYLFYSSDGLPGIGGLDIYCATKQANGAWGSPVNMKAPFNSSRDDFGLNFEDGMSAGYFSSSREGNGTVDKIYRFNKLLPKFDLEGLVYNKFTNNPIRNAVVQFHSKTSGRAATFMTDASGRFYTALDTNNDYELNASKEKYHPASATASTVGKTESETIYVKMALEPEIEVISFVNIYYDFDKWNIRKDAAEELDKVAEKLKTNGKIHLVLGAHADSRGTDAYNMKLTEKRAKSAVDYLANKGIDRARLNPEWFGESQPANECKDEVICTPAKHQLNRRTEFKVILLETE